MQFKNFDKFIAVVTTCGSLVLWSFYTDYTICDYDVSIKDRLYRSIVIVDLLKKLNLLTTMMKNVCSCICQYYFTDSCTFSVTHLSMDGFWNYIVQIISVTNVSNLDLGQGQTCLASSLYTELWWSILKNYGNLFRRFV